MILYILNAQGTNLYKIGVTRYKVSKRIAALQTGNPNKIVVVWQLESEYANNIEKTVHRFYSYCKTSGEWFEFEDISLEEVKEKIKQIEQHIILIKENEKSSNRY